MDSELREQIAKYCFDDDFTSGMAGEPYVCEDWDLAPVDSKQSYLKNADDIIKIFEGADYHKIPELPLLSDKELNEADFDSPCTINKPCPFDISDKLDSEENDEKCELCGRRQVAQARRDLCQRTLQEYLGENKKGEMR